MKKYLTGFIAGILLSGGTFGLVKAYERPYCPTEDSCQIDFHHGAWHVTEVTP